MPHRLSIPRLLGLLGLAVTMMCGAGGSGAATQASPKPLFAAYAIGGAPEPVSLLSDDRVATLNRLGSAAGVAVGADGSLFVADRDRHRVERIDADGKLMTLAGTGQAGARGDGGPASAAQLRRPSAVAALPDGSVLVADTGNHRIRVVSSTGQIRTVAGCRRPGSSGDSGRATRACLNAPRGVATHPRGGFLIADTGNHRIRRVSAAGRIVTVAGHTAGFAGDGHSGRRARLHSPSGVAATPRGGLIIADTGNQRVRSVSAGGIIRTIAGGGRQKPGGATGVRAFLGRPVAVVPDRRGGVFIADAGLRAFTITPALYHLSPRGTLRTIVGAEGAGRLLGGVGPTQPVSAAVDRDGSVVVADGANDRILLLAPRTANRFAVRYAPRTLVVDAGAALTATVVATRAAEIEYRLLKAAKVLAEGRARIASGRTSLRLRDRIEEGHYRLELVARADDAIFTDALDVAVGFRTPVAAPAVGTE